MSIFLCFLFKDCDITATAAFKFKISVCLAGITFTTSAILGAGDPRLQTVLYPDRAVERMSYAGAQGSSGSGGVFWRI
jgi:hypothetical protein